MTVHALALARDLVIGPVDVVGTVRTGGSETIRVDFRLRAGGERLFPELEIRI